MKLQTNKTYWTRDRKRFVRIIDIIPAGYVGGYYIETDDFMTAIWNEDGSFVYGKETNFDLVEECPLA